MTDFMDDSRHDLPQAFQESSPSHTAVTSAGPLTPPQLYGLRQDSNGFDSLDLSQTAEPFQQDSYLSSTDDYFLGAIERYKSLKRDSADSQYSQSNIHNTNIYSTNQYHQQGEDWSPAQSLAISPPTRKLHDFSSRKSSSTLSNNLSPVSTSASSFEQYLPNSTSGELPEYPFYSTSMAPLTSPLDGLAEEFDFQDLTTKQDFNDTTTTKRTREENRPDAISACWTSPLCPNHGEGGEPPNPATCGGGCAPFLFGTEPLPDSINNAALDMAIIGVDQLAVNSQPQSKTSTPETDSQQTVTSRPKANGRVNTQRKNKRGESQTSTEPQGRVLPKTAADIKKSSSPEAASIAESIESHKKNSRQPHNKVEQKYRDSINNQMEALRKVVPSLSEKARACSDGADIEDLPVPSKPSKALILASATAFIKAQTKEKKQLEAENLLLRQRVHALNALVKCDDCSLMQYVVDLNLQNGR